MQITLTKKHGIEELLDFRNFPWDQIETDKPSELLYRTVKIGRRDVELGELFEVSSSQFVQDPSASKTSSNGVKEQRDGGPALSSHRLFYLRGDFQRSIGLGHRMERSTLVIDGDAGDLTGAELNGGRVCVLGNAGNYVGQSMQAGTLTVTGSCGDFLVAPRSGERSGMKGGTVFVGGDAGDRAAQRLRRGTVFIAGDCGESSCYEMLAGNFFLMGKLGLNWGMGMKRGTIVLRSQPNTQTNALVSDGTLVELNFLPLLWKQLRQCIGNLGPVIVENHFNEAVQTCMASGRRVYRQILDKAVSGRGEVLSLT